MGLSEWIAQEQQLGFAVGDIMEERILTALHYGVRNDSYTNPGFSEETDDARYLGRIDIRIDKWSGSEHDYVGITKSQMRVGDYLHFIWKGSKSEDELTVGSVESLNGVYQIGLDNG